MAIANLFILGAGFSKNAGLPLATEFTEKLIEVDHLKLDAPSKKLVSHIRTFVDKVFGEGHARPHDEWPELEDLFTLIDLSANTGHHLGQAYAASDLRVVRRAMLVRMIRMLSTEYTKGAKSRGPDWNALETFFTHFDVERSAVLSLNWDTVVERGLSRTQSVARYDYGCGASAADFKGSLLRKVPLTGPQATILKPHGSVNWLYCDACREMFWTPPERTDAVAQTLFRRRDWESIGINMETPSAPRVREPTCPHCDAASLGTRFATFSYRKALDFPMHSATWRAAEGLLKRTGNWIFVGYSMPPADFDFKHLLKRVQITEDLRPDITVITKGKSALETIGRFRKFFGEVDGERTYLDNGFDDPAIKHLRKIGALKRLVRPAL
jgi:hypothetical protein